MSKESETSVNARILDLMNSKNLSANELAARIGVSPSTIASIVYGRKGKKNTPSLETLEKIVASIDGVNKSWLMMGEGKMFSDMESANVEHSDLINRMPPRVIYVDEKNQERIPLVEEPTRAGYAQYYNDERYISELPTYSIPGFRNGTFRIFEVEGDSMYPSIKARDLIICSHVERFSDLKDGQIYVVVYKEGIVVKRVYNSSGPRKAVILRSDNPVFRDSVVLAEDILEVWEYRKRLTD